MRNLIIIIAAIFFAGCSFRPDLPNVDTKFEATYQFTSDIKDRWWEEFGDENLNALISDALNNNIDLKIAFLNLQKAEATLGVREADTLPNVNLNVSTNRTKNSGQIRGEQTIDSISLGLNYEIDFWGRVKNSIEAAKSSLQMSKFDYDTARLSISSIVAQSYFTLVSLNMKEQILKDTVKNYENTLEFRNSQFELGAIDEVVYLQSKAAVQSAKVNLIEVQNQKSSLITSLSILSGKTNDEILKSSIKSSKNLPKEPEIKAGISSDILFQRSDVASAYESLKATNALIGVAKAEYFPTISLTGFFGYSSDNLKNIFKNNANTWSFGATLVQKIFDYGRTKNNVKIAQTNEQIAALNYEKTIKTALSEVKDALTNRENAKRSQAEISDLLRSQQKIYNIAQSKFDEGYSSHLELLDAQRNLLSTRLQDANAKLNSINSAVGVYRAFGGGFKLQDTKE